MRAPQVKQDHGLKNSTFYKLIQNGEFVPPIRIAARSVAWPSNESDAIKAARIAGKSTDEIKALVKQLVAQRTSPAPTSI